MLSSSNSILADLKSLKLQLMGNFQLEDGRNKHYVSHISRWGALDQMSGFKLEFLLPENLVGSLNTSKTIAYLSSRVASRVVVLLVHAQY